ncbi:MAG: chemotaxis protein CheW [Burkholderiaceae bacterium]
MNTMTVTPPSASPACGSVFKPGATLGQEVLTFLLGEEEYGIRLGCVQEIRSYQAPTRLAGSRDDLLGVIDLRGEIVPLLDLRRRFALHPARFDGATVTIVVQVDGRRVGAVADQVNEVLNLAPGQIHPLPPLPGARTGHAPPHLCGLASLAGRRVLLLDIESLLRSSGDSTASH